MPHFNSWHHLPEKKPTAVAVGVFDGVHRGHQALLTTMIAAARARELRTAVVTFFPHPKAVLRNLTGRLYLNTLSDRVYYLEKLGIDVVMVCTFDNDTRQMRAAEFTGLLQDKLDMRQIWSGDFGLGYKREGTAAVLEKIGRQTGFTVHEYAHKLYLGDSHISSSRIRNGLAAGDLEDVTMCLGRPYRLTGTVIMGDQRGRTIGFPTANIDIWEQILVPGKGVYATTAYVGSERYAAATNIGVRPTVDGHTLRIEPHLLDFAGDLYGQELTLEFIARIRPEKKFDGLEALKEQIGKDVALVREIIL